MPKLTNMLLHIDTLADTHPALDGALDLARSQGASLTVVDIIPDFSWPVRLVIGGYEKVIEQVTHTKGNRLKEIMDAANTEGVDVTTKLLDAPTSVSIVREAIRGNHDLVIKAAKGQQSRRRGRFGTTATRLFRKCPCPVLLLKSGHEGDFRNVVAAVDATSTDEVDAKLNLTIIEMAELFRAMGDGQLDLVHVWEVYGEGILKDHMPAEELEDVRHKAEVHAKKKLAELLSTAGLTITDDRAHLVNGDPGHEIPQFVSKHQTDLLVMGTVGRAGISGLLIGNTAERILGDVDCSVLAVKPEGFVSPITADD